MTCRSLLILVCLSLIFILAGAEEAQATACTSLFLDQNRDRSQIVLFGLSNNSVQIKKGIDPQDHTNVSLPSNLSAERKKWIEKNYEVRVIEVQKSNFPYSEFIGETFAEGEQTFHLMNVGQRQLQLDKEFVNQAFDKSGDWTNAVIVIKFSEIFPAKLKAKF
jgi:hypothetical protein